MNNQAFKACKVLDSECSSHRDTQSSMPNGRVLFMQVCESPGRWVHIKTSNCLKCISNRRFSHGHRGPLVFNFLSSHFDSEKVTFITKLYKELRQFELYRALAWEVWNWEIFQQDHFFKKVWDFHTGFLALCMRTKTKRSSFSRSPGIIGSWYTAMWRMASTN